MLFKPKNENRNSDKKGLAVFFCVDFFPLKKSIENKFNHDIIENSEYQ
jgi:hypothetical protein